MTVLMSEGWWVRRAAVSRQNAKRLAQCLEHGEHSGTACPVQALEEVRHTDKCMRPGQGHVRWRDSMRKTSQLPSLPPAVFMTTCV